MREEYVDACPEASPSWRKWLRSNTKNTSQRSAILGVAALAFLWSQGGPPLIEERYSEDGVRQFQSIDYSMSVAAPTQAVTSHTNMHHSFGGPYGTNISQEVQKSPEHVLRLCANKGPGDSTKIMLITGNDQTEGGYSVSCVDNILFSPVADEPASFLSYAVKVLVGLVCVAAAYLAIPYPLPVTGVSDQHFASASIPKGHPTVKESALPKSCPFSKTSTAAPSPPPSTASPAQPPKAADAVRKSNLLTPTQAEWKAMSDEEAVNKAIENKLALYSLEKVLGDSTRAVQIRRGIVARNPRTQNITSQLEQSNLPFANYDYDRVLGACCENVIGYLPLPLGVAGPLDINGSSFYLPMATTEGVLVASTNRGATAINACGGVTTSLLADGMTRGPALRFPGLERAAAFKHWLDTPEGYSVVETAFNSTTRYGRLQSVRVAVTGSDVFARFKATTGDAMGMNMISKGVDAALAAIRSAGFDDMQIVSLSGNYCTDKKAAAINWIDGRGKSVCAQATVAADVLRRVLKTDVDSLVALNTSKNLVGSAVAGAMGGFNAHASNIVTAIFLATGQDPAQNVESSACLTTMKKTEAGDLEISVYMPSIEVGTVGGGTILGPQAAMLDLLGVRGADQETPGKNAQRLACIVAAGVLAGELSLLSSLAAGSLVQSHMAHNRKA